MTNVLTFADPPEIEVDQGWVNVAEGNQGKLICTVYGNPTPNVSHCSPSYYLFTLTKAFGLNSMSKQFGLVVNTVLTGT